MTVLWTSQPHGFYCCLSLCLVSVLSQDFRLEPARTAVLSNSTVRFNATVPGIWEVMTWDINDSLVLSASLDNSFEVIPSSEQFSARLCSDNDTSCVEFSISSVTRNQSGPVVCRVLGAYGSRTASLTVQESGTVSIMNREMTVTQDQQVEFQCLTGGWYPQPTVGWSLNGIAVNSSLYNTSSVEDGDSFNSTSILNFKAVSSATVECWATVAALTSPRSSSVDMVVVPKPPDWTVLIAMVVSIGGLALLLLLIFGIIFCYKRRIGKQTTYQDEIKRRARSHSQRTDASGQQDGKENQGYVSDDHTSSGPWDCSDSGVTQAKGSGIFEMSDVVNSHPAVYDAVGGSAFKKHRHMTTV